MSFQLKRRKEQLLELRDKWSQPPPKKVNESPLIEARWRSTMVSYDEYERCRYEAEVRAARIWREHVLAGGIWRPAESPWTDRNDEEENSPSDVDETPESTNDSSDEDAFC
jgi:hypothetical protein